MSGGLNMNERKKGAFLFLSVLLISVLVLETFYGSLSSVLILSLAGGILALVLSILLKKRKDENS